MYLGTTEQLINALNHMADSRPVTVAERAIAREAADRLRKTLDADKPCCPEKNMAWIDKHSDLIVGGGSGDCVDVNFYQCDHCGDIRADAE